MLPLFSERYTNDFILISNSPVGAPQISWTIYFWIIIAPFEACYVVCFWVPVLWRLRRRPPAWVRVQWSWARFTVLKPIGTSKLTAEDVEELTGSTREVMLSKVKDMAREKSALALKGESSTPKMKKLFLLMSISILLSAFSITGVD